MSAAGGAAAPLPERVPLGDDDPVLAPDPAYRDPAPLPSPPTSATVSQVLLYLLRLAFGEAGLTWRLVGALGLLAM